MIWNTISKLSGTIGNGSNQLQSIVPIGTTNPLFGHGITPFWIAMALLLGAAGIIVGLVVWYKSK